MSEYPKTMRHPEESLAVVGQRTVDAHGRENYGQGTTDRLQRVIVNSSEQEQEYRAKGYLLPGEARPEYRQEEYPKWDDEKIIDAEGVETKPPPTAPIASARRVYRCPSSSWP